MPPQSTLVVREARRDERETMLAIVYAAYAQYEPGSDPAFWERYQENIRHAFLNDELPLRLIAVEDDKILGCVLLYPVAERAANDPRPKSEYPEMRLLGVSPEARNKGVGAKLIKECEHIALESGASCLSLHTTVLMQVAKDMYLRRGYERHSATDFEPVPGFIVMGFLKNLK